MALGQNSATAPPLTYFMLVLHRFGGTPERRAAIMAGTGISESQLNAVDEEMPVVSPAQYFPNLIKLCGDDWFFEVPEFWSETAQAEFGLARQSAPDFETALEVTAEFVGIRWPGLIVKSRKTADATRHSYHVAPSVAKIDGPVWQCMCIIIALNHATVSKRFLGADSSMIGYEFEGEKPCFADRVAHYLGGRQSWGHPVFTIDFPRIALGRSSPLSDKTNFRTAMGILRAKRDQMERASTVAGQVSEILLQMTDGRLGLDETARRLGMSGRTLSRRLDAEGETFRKLLDSSLQTRIEILLAGPRLNVETIAEKLGYSDAASLHRACRRWFGRSLSKHRRALL